MKTAQLHQGKTAKEWFKLHEVMRKDFTRLLRKVEPLRRFSQASKEPDRKET